MMYVRKKDNTVQPFDINKVILATSKSAVRALSEFSAEDIEVLKSVVTNLSENYYNTNHEPIPILMMHSFVENALDKINPEIAKSYKDYRNYKTEFSEIMDHVYRENQRIMYRGDQENSNMNSALVSTKRSLCYNVLEEELFKKFFLNTDELQAQNDGYIYIHDKSSRLDTMNCCLFDISNVLKDGFWFSNMWYSEPKSLDTFFDVVSDVTLSSAGQQYGGFTLPQFDEVAYPYILKSKKLYEHTYDEIASKRFSKFFNKSYIKRRSKWVNKQIIRDIEQGWQGFEYKFNTVACSRGDYPFIAVSLGNGKTEYHKLFTETILRVHMKGQGKPNNKIPVVFPKITFLYDKNMHGKHKKYYDTFKLAIECSAKTMYPDFLSLTGEGYIPDMYKKYGKIVSLMGCRASLSPWFKNGGMYPIDENDEPEFIGRFNIGAITLNLPMIYQKSKEENRDFYEVLDYYLEMIRKIHIRTYEYIANMKASCNPLGFCEGGFYHGNLKPNDKIGLDFLRPMTASFGITALNELEVLATGKQLHEIPINQKSFSEEVMEYINNKVDKFKEEDGWLYAIYGTPAESLCLSGDTEVQCYPSNKLIKDIKVGDLVYTYNEDTKGIELKPVIKSSMTSKSSKVIKIVTKSSNLDNEIIQEFICTPNHPFALRRMNKDNKGIFIGGEYIEYVNAEDLKIGDRLKSNYMLDSKGYICTSSGQKRCNIIYEYFNNCKISKGYIVHHKDEDKYNDDIDNLQLMTEHDHKSYHTKDNIQKYNYTSESQSGSKNSFYEKHHSEESKMKISIKNKGKHPWNYVDPNECLKLYESGLSVEDIANKFKVKKETIEYKLNSLNIDLSNHIIIDIQYLSEEIPVYNLNVEDNHNFYIGGDNGVLVHNCGKQIKSFRAKYGIIPGVSDREYTTNSFHCHVTADITPTEKQNREKKFWNLFNGGKIQYTKQLSYNLRAIEESTIKAMEDGFYYGNNTDSMNYCMDCGYHGRIKLDEPCPKCGSMNIYSIDRMNGYLSVSRGNSGDGSSRLNSAKMSEIRSRISM